MESKNKLILSSAIGLVSVPIIARLMIGKSMNKNAVIEFSIYGIALGALVGAFVSSISEKDSEKKSNVVTGGSTFDEVCYKNCTNSCKLDDSACFTKCRANCTSKGGGKATSNV